MTATDPPLVIGEVTTALLQHSIPVSADEAAAMLAAADGDQISRATRPVEYLRSAHRYLGVDCKLPGAGRAKARCVGSPEHYAAIIGGQVVQATAFARVHRSVEQRRLPWAHYTAASRRGCVETIGKVDSEALADGFLVDRDRPGTLNFGAIADRRIDDVQGRGGLDRQPPLRSSRIRLRFAIDPGPARPILFGIDRDGFRRLRVPALADTASVLALCEDIALHDWLLTALLDVVGRGRAAPARRFAEQASPVLERLAHLWLPGGRLRGALPEVWPAIEARTGMSRQWSANVQRIRDQIAVSVLDPARPAPRGRRRAASADRPEEGVLHPVYDLVGGQV